LVAGGDSGGDLLAGGGEGVNSTAQAGGGELGGEVVDGSEISFVGQAGAVVFAPGAHAFPEKGGLAVGFEAGEFGGGAGLREAGSQGIEFGVTGALKQVLEAGAGLKQAGIGLRGGGGLGRVLQRE
jgi:hypothetical protein